MRHKIIILKLVFLTFINKLSGNDSLSIVKEYIVVNKNYQKPPLHLNITYKSTNNLPGLLKDTLTLNGIFHYESNYRANIFFGDFEQVIEDSIVATITNSIKKITVYKGSAKEMQERMIKLGISNLPDSAYQYFLKIYQIEKKALNEDDNIIKLTNKNCLKNSKQPIEEIELLYSNSKKEPKRIIKTTKKLINAQRLELDSISLNKFEIILIDNEKYIVYNEIDSFDYNLIEHSNNITLRKKITDVLNFDNNKYFPAKGYEQYVVSEY